LVRLNGREYPLDGRLIDNVRIEGGDGDDYLVFAVAGSIEDAQVLRPGTVLGGAGNDRISTSGGNNVLDGGAGNDDLYGWGGADTFVGGEGDDLIQVAFPDDVTLGGPGENVIWAWRRAIAGSDGTGLIEEMGPNDVAPTFFTDDGTDGGTDQTSTDGQDGSQAGGGVSDGDLAVVLPPANSDFGDAFAAGRDGWWFDGGGDPDQLWDMWEHAPGQAA
jgi:hypothetical protein